MTEFTPHEFSEQLFALGYSTPDPEQLLAGTMALISRQWGCQCLTLFTSSGDILFSTHCEQAEFKTSYRPENDQIRQNGDLFSVPLSDQFFLLSDQPPAPLFSSLWAKCFADHLQRQNSSSESITAEQITRMVMDSIPTRVFWKNTSKHYEGANQAFMQDAGVSSAVELRGMTINQLPWANQNRQAFDHQDDLLLSGQTESADYEEALLINGKIQWIQGHKQVIRNNKGEISGILGTYHDISARKQDEEKLRLLATAFESHEGIVIANSEGIILEMNAAFCEITGYSADEIAGKTFQVLHSGRQNQQFYRDMWESINQRGRWEGEVWNKRKNGEIYPEWLTITAVTDDNNEVTHYVGAFVDLTEIKAQQAKVRRAAVQDQLIAQVFRLTLQGSSIGHYLQRTMELILESQPWLMSVASVHLAPYQEQTHWQTVFNLNLPGNGNSSIADHPDTSELLKELAQSRQPRTLLSCHRCKSAPPHGHLLIPLQIEDQFIGVVILALRAFDNHNPDDESLLMRLFNVLALGISRRQTDQALIAAKEEAERANLAKSQFLSSMSHELRTPLNAILGFAQLLELEELDETQLENVTEIIHAGRHLLELINEVLDLAKIEAGRLDLSIEPVPLNMVISECLSLTQPLADKRQITINCDQTGLDSLRLIADRTRVKQIILNLMSNAVKYNKESGFILLEFSTPEYGIVRISVKDTGAGIPDDKKSEIFQPFQRLGAEASNVEGTGIGLVISQKLARSMKGELSFSSQENQGSHFWIDLPQHLSDPEHGDEATDSDTL